MIWLSTFKTCPQKPFGLRSSMVIATIEEPPLQRWGGGGVNSGQIFNAWNVNLRLVNRYAAFYADDFKGGAWSRKGNNWYLISTSGFRQCYDDNTNCNIQPNFVPLDFN